VSRNQQSQYFDSYALRHPQFLLPRRVGDLLAHAVERSAGTSSYLLDVGCGEGGTLFTLREWGADARLIGLDVSRHRAAIANRWGFATGTADGGALPVRTESMSLVLLRHVIEHVEDESGLLEELCRVLVPGGALYVETPLRLRGAWYPHRNRDRKWVLDPTHLREYESQDALADVLSHAGFDVEAVELVPVRFPLGHLALRALPVRDRLSENVRRALLSERFNLHVPRYREMQVLCRRSSRRIAMTTTSS
jgi:SAM-dependent methyltransferase